MFCGPPSAPIFAFVTKMRRGRIAARRLAGDGTIEFIDDSAIGLVPLEGRLVMPKAEHRPITAKACG
jgi:hypothetical protein